MFRVQLLICMFVVSLIVLPAQINAAETQDTQVKSILVTGATTGIGRNLAETLANMVIMYTQVQELTVRWLI